MMNINKILRDAEVLCQGRRGCYKGPDKEDCPLLMNYPWFSTEECLIDKLTQASNVLEDALKKAEEITNAEH